MADDAAGDERQRKERSPSFPFISLRKAIERAQALLDKHRREPARLSSVAVTWDYGLKSSGLLQTVAALKQYGLIEDFGSGEDRKVQLTDLARRILMDQRPGAREAAVKEAARRPRLIAEYLGNWVPERPSDGHCLSELHLDRGFNPEAAKLFLKIFDDTVAFARLSDDDNMSSNLEEGEDEPMQSVSAPTAAPAAPSGANRIAPSRNNSPSLEEGEPFMMSIFGGRIELVARLETPDQVEELIKRLEFAKMMIVPLSELPKGRQS